MSLYINHNCAIIKPISFGNLETDDYCIFEQTADSKLYRINSCTSLKGLPKRYL